jgi:hypothetical protein
MSSQVSLDFSDQLSIKSGGGVMIQIRLPKHSAKASLSGRRQKELLPHLRTALVTMFLHPEKEPILGRGELGHHPAATYGIF